MIDDLEDSPEAVVHELVEVVGLAKGRADLANLVEGLLGNPDGDSLALGHLERSTTLSRNNCNASLYILYLYFTYFIIFILQ